MIFEWIVIIILLAIGGIFLLCDDRDEIIANLKTINRVDVKLFFLILLPVVICLGYNIYLKQAVWIGNDALWNPYMFGGMPSYAVSYGGFRWWNLIYVFVDTIKIVVFYNPVGALIFIAPLVWLYYHRNIFAYLLMLFIECLTLYFAFLGFGISKGYL